MQDLELQHKVNQSKPKQSFDVTTHIRLVHPFQEKEVDKYFMHFEKVAENLKWPLKKSIRHSFYKVYS